MNIKKLVKKAFFLISFILVIISTIGCTNKSASLEGIEKRLTKEEDKIFEFKNGHNSELFQISYWSNGYPFDCKFSPKSIKFENGFMYMSLFKEEDKYYGGEYRTYKRYTYGYFSVAMKPIKCDGVISSFFTYTHNPWDEIDIEFLGDDTTIVQFNYYTKGKGAHEYHYNLGFDASEEIHEYGFDWRPDSITWFVDGKPVYRATKDIPTTSAQILANVWNVHPNVAEWAGLFKDDNLPVTASYEWFAYSPYVE